LPSFHEKLFKFQEATCLFYLLHILVNRTYSKITKMFETTRGQWISKFLRPVTFRPWSLEIYAQIVSIFPCSEYLFEDAYCHIYIRLKNTSVKVSTFYIICWQEIEFKFTSFTNLGVIFSAALMCRLLCLETKFESTRTTRMSSLLPKKDVTDLKIGQKGIYVNTNLALMSRSDLQWSFTESSVLYFTFFIKALLNL